MSYQFCSKCIENDLKWENVLKIPKLIEYCGSVKSSDIISFKLLYYRIFASIYSITILIWNFLRFVRHHIAEYWLIYLSQWIAIIITVYFILISMINLKLLHYITINMINISSITSSSLHKDNSNNNTSSNNHNINILFEGDGTLRCLSKFCSILFSMCFAPSIIITIANWTVNTDYNAYIEANNTDDIEKCFNDIHMHGVLLILLIIDYSLSMLYLSYNSIIYSLIFGLLFIIWSLIHYAAKLTNPWNKRYIYPTLNWKYPQTAIFVTILLLIFMILIHYLFSYIKYNCILNKSQSKQQQQQQQKQQKQIPNQIMYGITNGVKSNTNSNNKSSQQSFPPNTPSNVISIANSQSNFSINSNTNKLELALNNTDIKISNHPQNRLSFEQLDDEEEIDDNNNNNNNNNKKTNNINLSIDNLEKLESVSEIE